MRVRILLSLPRKAPIVWSELFSIRGAAAACLAAPDKARINPRECAGRGVPAAGGDRSFSQAALAGTVGPTKIAAFLRKCNAAPHRGPPRFDGGTMFPRKPLLLGRRFGLGVSPGQSLPCVKGGARAVGGGIVLRAFACQRLCREQGAFSPRYVGVQGPFRASCRTVSIDAPGAFSLGPLQRPVLFSREKRMGGWEHFPLGKKKARPPGAKLSMAAHGAEIICGPWSQSPRPRAARGNSRPPQGNPPSPRRATPAPPRPPPFFREKSKKMHPGAHSIRCNRPQTLI